MVDQELVDILTNDSGKKSIMTCGASISLLSLKCNEKLHLSHTRLWQPAMWTCHLTHPSWSVVFQWNNQMISFWRKHGEHFSDLAIMLPPARPCLR